MAIKTYKPTTPSRRHMTVSAFEGIDKKAKPERSLTENLKKNAGRNSYGRITVRHRGGGNKKKYRIIDFKRQKDGVEATVLRLEYDPNRSANIALIQYTDGEKAYILAPVGLKPGHKIVSGPEADILPGNCLPICDKRHPGSERQGSGGQVGMHCGKQFADRKQQQSYFQYGRAVRKERRKCDHCRYRRKHPLQCSVG